MFGKIISCRYKVPFMSCLYLISPKSCHRKSRESRIAFRSPSQELGVPVDGEGAVHAAFEFGMVWLGLLGELLLRWEIALQARLRGSQWSELDVIFHLNDVLWDKNGNVIIITRYRCFLL